ncbi:MAG: CapA family protein [Acidimicrobiales bacterium]|nr:CapA family protein [Acidimicrobiales bacterium]
MSKVTRERESQVAWRLTQVTILAFITIFILSITDKDLDDTSSQIRDSNLVEAQTSNEPSDDPSEMELVTSSSFPENSNDLRTFTFVATGELLIHEFVADSANSYDSTGFDFSPMFRKVAPIILGADLAICHLETPLSPDNSVLNYYPTFQVPYELALAIKWAGYDGCSIASNHLLDNGVEGIKATISHLENSGIKTSGGATQLEDSKPSWFTPGGISVAHLSYTDLMNCDISGTCGGASLPLDPPWLVNHLEVKKILDDADSAVKDGAEFVIASLHWGEAYSSEISDSQQKIIAELLSSDLIDLIIGHGTHVIQPVIKLSNKYAVPGMGNFLSNQPGDERRSCSQCPPSTQDGMIAWFSISDLSDGNIGVVDAGYVPTWVDRSTYEITPIGIGEPDTLSLDEVRKSELRTDGVIGTDLRKLVFEN